MTHPVIHHGIATALRQTGPKDGTPVLVVHGFAADMTVWMLAEPALRDTCRLTLLDLPGHGATAAEIPRLGLEGFGQHLASVIDSVGSRKIWLLAHSFGAAVALRATSLAPDRIAGLILIAPAGLTGQVDPDFIAAICDAPDAQAMRAALGQMLVRPQMITLAMAETLHARMLDPSRGTALRAVGSLLPELPRTLAPHLPALAELPIHVLRGAQDRIICPDVALPAVWPQAQAHRIEGAGHLPQLEAPAPTLHLVRAALGVA